MLQETKLFLNKRTFERLSVTSSTSSTTRCTNVHSLCPFYQVCFRCDLCGLGIAGYPKLCFTLTAAPKAQSAYFKDRTSEYLLQNFISLCLWNYVTIWGFGALLMGSSSALWKCPSTSHHLEPSALIGFFHLNIGCLMIEKRSRECKRQSVIANAGCIQSGYGWRGRCQSSGGPLFSGLRHKPSSDSFMSPLALAFPRIWTLSTPGISSCPSDNIRDVWLP